MSTPEFILRYEAAKDRSLRYHQNIKDTYDFFCPKRNTQNFSEGQNTNAHLYDNTGELALRNFVSQVVNALVPPGVPFFDLEAGSEVPKDAESEVNEQLQKIVDIATRYVDRSALTTTLTECAYDLGVSTGCMLLNKGDIDDPLIFTSAPLLSVYIEEGPRGRIDSVFRDWNQIPIRNIKRMWENAKLTENMQQALSTDITAKTDVTECTIYDAKKKLYEYIVFSTEEQSVLYKAVDKSSPWIVFRGDKRPGECFGNGPASSALSTLKMLNEIYRTDVMQGTLKVSPPWIAQSDSIFNPNNFSVIPNSILTVMDVNNPPLSVLPVGGDVQYSQIKIEDLRKQINDTFFRNPLGDVSEGQPRTATEMRIRHQIALEEQIPFYARIQNELLKPLVDRILYILKSFNIISDIVIDGKVINVRYKSPVIQKYSVEKINNLMQMVEMLQQILGPQMSISALNSTKIPEYLAKNLNVDLELVRSEKDLDAMQDQVQQAMQQQTQLPQQPAGGLQQQQLGSA